MSPDSVMRSRPLAVPLWKSVTTAVVTSAEGTISTRWLHVSPDPAPQTDARPLTIGASTPPCVVQDPGLLSFMLEHGLTSLHPRLLIGTSRPPRVLGGPGSPTRGDARCQMPRSRTRGAANRRPLSRSRGAKKYRSADPL